LRTVVQAVRRGDAIGAGRLQRASIRSQREFYVIYPPTIGDVGSDGGIFPPYAPLTPPARSESISRS
jgi:hypothetical protein